MFQTHHSSGRQGQENLYGTHQLFGRSVFTPSAEEQEYLCGHFQKLILPCFITSVYKEDDLYYSGKNEELERKLQEELEQNLQEELEELERKLQEELEQKLQEELEKALETLSYFTLPYIDQVVTPDWSVTDCEDILHLMTCSDTKHVKIAFNVLLRNKLHDNVYEAAKKIFLNKFVCHHIWYKFLEMCPYDREEDCSLLLKLIYMCKPTSIDPWRLGNSLWSILSVAEYFPKLVNVKYCELLLDVVCYSYNSFNLKNKVSAISNDNFFICLFETCLKIIKHKFPTRESRMRYHLVVIIFIFCVCWKQLQSKKQQEYGKQLIIKYKDVILSLVKDITNDGLTCDERQQYCMMLLHLLHHHYNSTKDVNETRTILVALTDLKVRLWNKSNYSSDKCYCFGGTKGCSHYHEKRSISDTKYIAAELLHRQREILRHTFQYNIDCDCDCDCDYDCDCDCDCDYNYGDSLRFKLIEDVSVGKIKFDQYLDALSKSLFDKTNQRYADISYTDVTCTDTVVYQFSSIMEKIIDHNKEEKILSVIKSLYQYDIPTELRDLLAQGLIAAFKVKYFKQTVQISKLILDMNMKTEKCEFMDYLTTQISKLLNLDGNKEEILYKCFCILRHENRHSRSETNSTEIYREHFTFISRLEKEEEMEKLLRHMELVLLVMLLLVCVSNGGHHSSAELKKYLSLKYEYDNAILYLLWCSGDVEINPGPTLKEIKKVPPSVKKRNWIYHMCSTLLKILTGSQANENKNKDLWKIDIPAWWPQDIPFYDPRNKKKGKDSEKKADVDEKILQCLINCFRQQFEIIPKHLQDLRIEITAWENKDETYLNHHILRQEVVEIRTAIQQLVHYKDTPELTQHLKALKISINFGSNKGQQKSMADVIKDIKVTLERVSHGEEPLLKCTGISEKPPEDLKPDQLKKYNTGKKRIDKHKNSIAVLINYCEQTGKEIPKDFHPVLNACKSGDMNKIQKCYTIWAYVAIIEHSLRYLQVEELLHKHNLHDKLKELNELIDIQSWERNQHQNEDDEATSTVSPQPGPSTAHCSQHLPLANHNIQGDSSPLCSVADQQTRFVQKRTKKTTGKRKRKPGKNEPGCTAQKRQFVCHDDKSFGGLVSTNEQVPVDSIVQSQEDVQMVLEFSSNISIGSNTAGSSDVTQSYMTINDDGTTNTTVTVSQTVSTSSPNSEQSSSLDKMMSKHYTDSDSNGQQIGSPTLDDKFKQILRELNL